ncbi:sulfite exporter TauE/SafE family protein, partial [Delftia sp. BR1]
MRRRGASMAAATAMASPLSLPMAVAGTAAYMLASQGAGLGPWHVGYVDLQAFALLTAGSWTGIRLAAPLIGRIPDALHAKAYLALLGLVLLVMIVA